MSAYTWAAIVGTWLAADVVIVAFFIGRDRLLDDYKQYCADYAAEQQKRVQS